MCTKIRVPNSYWHRWWYLRDKPLSVAWPSTGGCQDELRRSRQLARRAGSPLSPEVCTRISVPCATGDHVESVGPSLLVNAFSLRLLRSENRSALKLNLPVGYQTTLGEIPGVSIWMIQIFFPKFPKQFTQHGFAPQPAFHRHAVGHSILRRHGFRIKGL